MPLDELVPLDPVHFFAFQIDGYYSKNGKLEKKHLLPTLSSFHDGRPFAEVFMGWNEKGIFFQISIQGRFDEPDFPNFSAADSVELFFDTRDVKTTGYTTRFCHHFFFLPEAMHTNGESIQAGEITRFRTDDVHKLCDASLLQLKVSQGNKEKVMNIFIPSECLHGYDPSQFDRLGFTYRMNRITGMKQYFSASDADFSIEGQPSLWASFRFVT